jgi:hypothetical protein
MINLKQWILASLVSLSTLNAQQNSREDMTQPVATEDKILQVLQGRLDTFRSGSVCSPLQHAEFQERDQNFVYAWGMDYVCGNGIIEKDLNRIPSDSEIDWTIEHFSSKKLPFMWVDVCQGTGT